MIKKFLFWGYEWCNEFCVWCVVWCDIWVEYWIVWSEEVLNLKKFY